MEIRFYSTGIVKPLKFEVLLKKSFIASGRNDPCWDACGTSGIITLGEKYPEVTLLIDNLNIDQS